MLDQIMEVLTPRRMMSVGNLSMLMEMEPVALHPRLQQLEAGGRIRYALSKCAGSCSTCSSGCGDAKEDAVNEAPAIDPSAIVISMERINSEE